MSFQIDGERQLSIGQLFARAGETTMVNGKIVYRPYGLSIARFSLKHCAC